MRLSPRQLRSELRSGPGPLYLVSGDEPLLVDETLDLLRRAARQAGCEERELHVAERGFDWEAFRAGLGNLSLFASRRLVELRLPTGKPGDRGAKQLAALAAEPAPDVVLVVITPALAGSAAKSKWVRSLAEAGAWIPLKAPSPEQLPAWLSARLEAAGLTIAPEALELLAARVEGNLLAAKQEIDKLVLLADGGRVELDTLRAVVGDGARFDVFQLADAALDGDSKRTARILEQLEREGVAAALALWGLTRETATLVELRQRIDGGEPAGRALAAAGVWRSREGLVRKALDRTDAGIARSLLTQAAATDRIVKGALPGQPWNALMDFALALSGRPVLAGGRT